MGTADGDAPRGIPHQCQDESVGHNAAHSRRARGAYTERSHEACNELLTYEQLSNGGWAARRGCHDDIVMTRAIALEVMAATTDAPATPALRLPYW